MTLRRTIDRFCDTNMGMRADTPEIEIRNLQKKFQQLADREYNNKSPINDTRPKWNSTRHSIEVDAIRTRNCNSMMRTTTGWDQSQRLNSQALELLNKTSIDGGSPTIRPRNGMSSLNADI